MKRHSNEQSFKDPVCGMEVSHLSAVADFEYKGKMYYFCADICKDAFKENPEKYLNHLPQHRKMPK